MKPYDKHGDNKTDICVFSFVHDFVFAAQHARRAAAAPPLHGPRA